MTSACRLRAHCNFTGCRMQYRLISFQEAARSAVTVVGLPDSGFFLEHEDPVKQYRSGLQWQFQRFNNTASMAKGCIDAYISSGEQWKCMFAQHALPFVQTPVFLLQPRYDSWQARENLHSKDPRRLVSWGANLTNLVQSNFLEQNPQHAAFLDSCSHHCGDWGTLQTPEGVSQPEAFTAWYANISEERPVLQQTWMQAAQYPCLGCCSVSTSTWAFRNNGRMWGVVVGLLVAATVATVLLVSISGNILSRRPVSSKIYGQLPSWMPSWFSPAILGDDENEIMLKAMN
ncbi:hypothetical protein CYMTET_26283 [Cymbomonas tetramitiformis]|uniref:Pectin acetylesterase n=1 Tax=Cymbomonas tetramitiformis TaxID=36881 RepID=A0AAE0KY20_9CHLO|nr:hypothetical protein CYMTET_26283 [Cymbomonas tetramitiformis]